MIRCLYLSQELSPYFVEGGLGLTTSELPIAVHQVSGIEYTIMLPYYPKLVRKAGLRTELLARLPTIRISNRNEAASINRVLDLGGPCEVLLVRSDAWYDREGGIYRDRDYVQYEDAIPRGVFFGWCVARWWEANSGCFSLIHGNDWQSGMALFLISRTRLINRICRPALLYEIHTAVAQGGFNPNSFAGFHLDPTSLAVAKSVSGNQPSLMLLGMYAADALVTCSPTYSRELYNILADTPMLEPLKRLSITGIVSGINSQDWDPAHPDTRSERYTAATVERGKRCNKHELQKRFGLTVNEDLPVYGICSRLVPEKGIELILAGLKELLRAGRIQMVVIGVGDRIYRDAFEQMATEIPGAICYHPAFNMDLARLLYAGCDFTLMPSLTEPCGLNQLISMRYGTLPIVNPVGGLKDTVSDVVQDPENGTGFLLRSATADELRHTVEQSISWLQRDRDLVRKTRQRVMGLDWSWARAALEYVALYESMLRRTTADRPGSRPLDDPHLETNTIHLIRPLQTAGEP